MRDDPVVFRLPFSGHQSCQFIERGFALGLCARQTVIALGLIFSPFTIRTLIFVGASVAIFAVLPFLTPWFFKFYGGRVSELEAKYLLFVLLAMGGLAVWSGSEAVLPAYIIGMVLAGTDTR